MIPLLADLDYMLEVYSPLSKVVEDVGTGNSLRGSCCVVGVQLVVAHAHDATRAVSYPQTLKSNQKSRTHPLLARAGYHLYAFDGISFYSSRDSSFIAKRSPLFSFTHNASALQLKSALIASHISLPCCSDASVPIRPNPSRRYMKYASV